MVSRVVAAVLAVLVGSAPAGAFGGRSRSAQTTYYYPAPVLMVPSYPFAAPPVLPTPVPAQPVVPPLAVPTPAPPSAGPATLPPTTPVPQRPVPAIREMRSQTDAPAPETTTSKKPREDHCAVGFWNVSGRDLVLRIDGRPQVLQPGKRLALKLGRTFVWQVEDREAQNEWVPAGQAGVEIVIRR